MISIEIDPPFEEKVDPGAFEELAAYVFNYEKVDLNSELTIRISDDDTIQQFNKAYLGIDAPTDVLSFPEDFTDPDTGNPYLGDIIISYPTAFQQAQAGGHPVEDELKLLAVHGILHLLGYDHANEAEKNDMWRVQSQILEELGISANPTE